VSDRDILRMAAANSATLDTGMTAGEAIQRAEKWWDAIGRHLIQQGSLADDPQSGILRGEPWDRLQRHEKLAIVKHWHHFFVRRPDLLDVDPAAQFRMGGGEVVH
jgi:hypothetical protein